MVNGGVRGRGSARDLAGVALLPARLLARPFAQLPTPSFFFSPSLDGGFPLLLLFNPSRRSSSAIPARNTAISACSACISAA